MNSKKILAHKKDLKKPKHSELSAYLKFLQNKQMLLGEAIS